MYRLLIRPFLFLLPAETAHNFASFFLKIAGLSLLKSLITPRYSSKEKGIELMGINFKSGLGMAAGFDKNAAMFRGLSNLGFSFVEIGTVTPLPQDGNPKPRLFRLKRDEALINRMGFNNRGLRHAVKMLKNRPKDIVIGGNIGKNKSTPNENAKSDYITCFNELHSYVDYFAINVSSPNTPGLRELQDKEPLLDLLMSLQDLNNRLTKQKPILLKIAPDLSESQLDDIVDIVIKSGTQGVIATNTTIVRENLQTKSDVIKSFGVGGLSGKPLFDRSLEVVKYLKNRSNGRFIIIGVGGIFSSEDALKMKRAGADLIQIYTGFVYNGPSLISEINRALNVND